MEKIWNIGERAFSYWEEDEYYYPGTILDANDGQFLVAYDDGNEAWVPSDSLTPLTLEPGDIVECLWEDGEYWNAKVLRVQGFAVEVEYEDQERKRVAIKDIRIWFEGEEGEEDEE